MKEIELRLAIVFYGGVSLAIYMHGVSREVLNLVRASAARLDRNGSGDASNDNQVQLSATQEVYRKLLDLMAQGAQIRVVTDAIAGASAGGVNGIMLARSIAHDLPLDSHTRMWLKNADVTRLSERQNGLSRYLKLSVSPVLDRLVSIQLNKQIESEETRDKLRQFMQARWFTPPFSGERFIGWMLDACRKMEDGAPAGRTLIPRGQTLDLFVTLTDYNGIRRRIHLDDPDYVDEWDHRRILNFHAAHSGSGGVESQFGSDCIPDLVFAARATSSFPGAFPPATVEEMDKVLALREEDWPNRTAFIARGLGLSEDDGVRHCFVDGSVVMNKPFAPVIDLIGKRPAAREVARRLIYVDPVPTDGAATNGGNGDVPGFFRVILASLAHIPRNEPIGDDLKEIEANNRRSRWLAQVVDAAGPMVSDAVAGLLPKRRLLNSAALAKCRADATAAAFRQAGFAFINYQSLKLHALAERLAAMAAGLAGPQGGPKAEEAVMTWLSARFSAMAADGAKKHGGTDPRILAILRGLDVDYRIRRLRFAIRTLNGFYHAIPGNGAAPPDTEALDRLKAVLYELIDHLGWRWSKDFYGELSRGLAVDVCATAAVPSNGDDDCFDRFVGQITGMMGLRDLDRLFDELVAVRARDLLDQEHYLAFLRSYVGFAYYDLITFPVLQRNDFAEVTEILVDRISPRDASSLYEEGFDLKGKELNTFGAFFNRSWREHDYLWGRLNAADRLVSIILSVAGGSSLTLGEIAGLKAELFRSILDEETGTLDNIPGEISRIEALIAERLDPKPEAAGSPEAQENTPCDILVS